MKHFVSLGYAVMASLLCGLPSLASATDYDYYLAGRELSPGLENGDTTYGVLFAGWTLDTDEWAPADQSTGGTWTATVRRTGDAGFDSLVTITGGGWTLQKPNGSTLWGRVLDGVVAWPPDADSIVGDRADAESLPPDIPLDCGDGVAAVQANVSLGFPWGRPRTSVGEIVGCLDDQEWLGSSDMFRLPPRIWLTLTLPR
jgi:hypothetical protein